MADALAGHAVEQGQGVVDQFGRTRLDGETEALLQPHRAQDARRVVNEAQAMEHAHHPSL